MECSKGGAYRAKEIAEKKLMAGDMQESLKFAQKAYELYPTLEGLSATIKTIEVHLAAHSKLFSGFKDWYAILHVSSSSGPDLINKQYKKLAFLLHPDKNKCVGAERAFKLITKAWEVLSDKTRKASFEVKRKCQEWKSSPYKPNVTNLLHTPIATISLKVNSTLIATIPNSPDVSNSSAAQYPFTFTGTCKTLEKTASANFFPETPSLNYLNCDHDDETPTPPKKTLNGHPQDSSIAPTNTNLTNVEWPIEMKPSFWTVCSSCQFLQDCPRSQEKQSIECSDCRGQYVASEVATISINDYTSDLSKTIKEENVIVKEEYVMNGVEDNEPNKNFTNHLAVQSKKAKRGTKKGKGRSRKRRKLDSVPFKEDPDVKIVDPLSMHVKDADFYDFDQDRVESCFEVNQIWAVYDDDGMPRYYALINNVVSLHPFEVQMSWLERKDDNDMDLIKWADAGFWRSCGEFKVGRKTSTEFLNVFSHVMKEEKVVAGFVKLFPRKGSVWAIYRNWQYDWNENTLKDVRHEYEIVEVMTDFSEKFGGSVLPLARLDGFTTVYQRKQMGCQAIRWILKTEFLRFSHQILARRLSGGEAQQLPKGCWELDPAAMPMG